MANSIDSSLINSVLAESAVTVLQKKLPFLGSFSTDFSQSVVAPKSTVNVPVVSSASAVQTNPTNFAQGDTTVTGAAVTLNQYSKSFHLTNTDIQEGHRLENLAKINMHAVANKINSVVMALVTTANYGDSATVVSGSAIDADDLKAVWGEITGTSKNIVLSSTAYSRFLPSNLESFDPTKGVGVYGFDRFDFSNDLSDSEADTGFVCAPEAMAIAAALPEMLPAVREQAEVSVITVPDLGLSFQVMSWVDINTRALWASFDICFGAAVADSNALKLIKAS